MSQQIHITIENGLYSMRSPKDRRRLILISDGEPDNEGEALSVASGFKSKIDTVYVGPANGYGADFLKRLAAATGGQAVTQSVQQIAELSQTVKRLLAA